MGTTPIDGRGFTIGQLFGNGPRYQLDPYQREYTWGREDVRQLLDDLERRFRLDWKPLHDRTETNRYAPYFLGPFVYFQNEGVTYLVDGQQRITTLHLLLIHLRRLLQQQDYMDDANRLEGLIRTAQFGRHTFTVDIEERAPLLTVLMENDDYTLPDDAKPSLRNLKARSENLDEDFPTSLLGEALPYFHDWLLNRVCLVGIEALDRMHGWEIFETMNDRGTRLTPIDLLKSFLLGKAERSRQKQLNEAWRGMLTDLTALGSSAPSDFIKALLLGRHADLGSISTDERDIEGSFHEWIRRRHHDLGLTKPSEYATFITNQLVPLAKKFCALRAAAQHPTPGLEPIFFNHLNGIRSQERLIMAATYAEESSLDFKEKARLIASYLDMVYVRRLIRGHAVHSSELDEEIRTLIPIMRDRKTPADVADVLGTATEHEAFPDFPTFGLGSDNRQQVHYLLARITAFVEVETKGADRIAEYLNEEHDYQIEHIWANNFERYRDQAPNRRDFDMWRNRIGALLLLHRSDNASYRDSPYREKLEHYQRQHMLSASLHKNAYKNNPRLSKFAKHAGIAELFRPFPGDFDKESIKTRQRLYQRLAEIIWDPGRLGFPVIEEPHQRNGPDRRTRAWYGIEVGHLIEAKLIKPADTLLGRRKSHEYTATVLSDGRIRVATGEAFSSLSRAGAFVKNTKGCAGWDFWHLKTRSEEIPLRELRAELLRRTRE